MQIVCVSRGTLEGGKRLSERLAASLGHEHLSREELTDAATAAGIPVGRIEMAVTRKRPLGERLGIELARYRAFVAATLCERLLERSLVYDGRTGHLILASVIQALRLRIIEDPERRITTTMGRLDIDREKACRYLEQVDEDRRRWVHQVHGIEWGDPQHYDAVVNLSHMSVENAASALVAMAQLPDFQVTPAGVRALHDLRLGARCRLAIGDDSRTHDLDANVRVDGGRVWVTYLPRQARLAEAVPSVLESVAGIEELLCTMATTNLLWIEEKFDPEAEILPHVLDIASRWNAAVELVQLEADRGAGASTTGDAEAVSAGAASDSTPNGGILDEGTFDESSRLDPGLVRTHDALISAGQAGGHRIVAGGPRDLLGSLERESSYSLVILGDVFRSKGEAPRKRLTRELRGNLAALLRIPVIGAEDLRTQYLFGRKQVVSLVVCGAIAALLLFAVFTNQMAILEFMTRAGSANRVMSSIVLLMFAPVFAYSYGTFTRMLLRLVKFE